MLKETGYEEKFVMLKPWLVSIIATVKKDLKNEHLKIDRTFCKKYFLGKNPAHVQAEEMAAAYAIDISSGNVGLGEFIATRWLLKNTDIYGFFEEKLKKIQPEFDQIEELSYELSEPLMSTSVKQFGWTRTYIFCVLNSVVFPEKIYAVLREHAETETQQCEGEKQIEETEKSLELLKKKHDREISALTDRFEKKFSGMQRKYINDMDLLKKQVSDLQRKLAER